MAAITVDEMWLSAPLWGISWCLKSLPCFQPSQKEPKRALTALRAVLSMYVRHEETKGGKEVKKVAGPGLQAETAFPKGRTACFVGRAMPHMQVGIITGPRTSLWNDPPSAGPSSEGPSAPVALPHCRGADGTQRPRGAK